MTPNLTDRWFPIARSEEIIPRHVVHAQLLGQEIALWRDDAGLVNAWENRCPHRGVRLSIGINNGAELQCRYHGWRYASGSGQCTYIPAHPDQKPSNVIRTKPYGAAEKYGFVWASLGRSPDAPSLPALNLNEWTTLRSIFVEAPPELVSDRLPGLHQALVARDPFIFDAEGTVTLLLQPVSAGQTLIHGLLPYEIAAEDRLGTLRSHNARLTEIRRAIESS
jgi:nitrite reductase/ring-hydroxylating ferredoxin subunit